MELTAERDRRHADAVARGERFYVDPASRLWVMTELAHRDRGKCCGSGCRHCPWAGTAAVHPGRAAAIHEDEK